MSFGFHRLTALWADRAAARDHFHAPARQHSYLGTRRPETDDRGGFGFIFFGEDLFDEQHQR